MIKKYTAILLLLISLSPLYSDNELVMDAAFFKKFSSVSIIARDEYLEGYLNSIIIGRGKIRSVTESERYRKKYRVTVESTDSVKYNHKFTFFLFLDNKDTAELLNVDAEFEFKGQFMGYTPVNTKRNVYIIDAVLMDASTVIE